MITKKPTLKGASRWFEDLELPIEVQTRLTREADAIDELLDQEATEARLAHERARELIAASAPAGTPSHAVEFGRPELSGRGPLARLFKEGVVEAAYRKVIAVGVSDKASQAQHLKKMKHIIDRGAVRRLHRPRAWQKTLAALKAAHTNFAAVLELIEEELVLSGTKRPIVLPPILLNGPPGCGKTFFAQHLAEFFQTGFVRVSMETAQTSAQLTGTAAHWSNTKPGQLFEQLVDGDYGNPVFLLDEIDKAGGYESHRADKALYGLLERKSAEQWADTSLPELTMDVSHVIWLLTSNDARQIPGPLRSRMRQFDIQPLGPHEARQLVRVLYRQEVRRYQHLRLNPELPIAHCDVMRGYSPRVIARHVHSLVARLAKERRADVTLADLAGTGALGDRLVELDRWFDCFGHRPLQ